MAALRARYLIVAVVASLAAAAIAAVVVISLRHRAATAAAAAPPPPSSEGAPPHKPQVYDYKEPPMVKIGPPLRPMDSEILDAIAVGEFTHAQRLDLFPDRPYHVKLIGSVPDRWISIVMIDLDRDGKWDEKWTLKPDSVIRLDFDDREPMGGKPFMLRHGQWVRF
jgi:hypothetical protein